MPPQLSTATAGAQVVAQQHFAFTLVPRLYLNATELRRALRGR